MSSEPTDEPPRKRVRKGTRSCWECKRRKIKCQLSTEDVSVCSGCLTRGTACLSQEYPEEREPTSNLQVGERLGRVERLLETLLAKISAYEEHDKAQKDILTPESMNDTLTPHPSNTPSIVQDTMPYLPLFEQSIFRRDDASQISTPIAQSPKVAKPHSCRPSKVDRVRQTLVDLLPSQKDADLISKNSAGWLIMHALCSQSHVRHEDQKEEIMSAALNMDETAKMEPAAIARTLLFLVVCLQQIDPEFDTSQLSLLPNIEIRVERYMSTIQASVTSDDEFITTREGLECLILQGVYHINAGSLRRAWLAFRRALNTAQLMGLHRPHSEVPGGRGLWLQIVQSDRALALLLGLPTGAPDDIFDPDETFENPKINKEVLFMRKLCTLSSKIIDRNQASNAQAYATTQEIDEQLELLAKKMPASYWEIPECTAEHRSDAGVQYFDRMVCQTWYFQLQSLLHLPFMLRASTERRYEYSKFSCLRASREMLYRYLSMHGAVDRSFCCKIMDFGALTAAVTLLLEILQASHNPETEETRLQRENDRALVHALLKALEEVSRGGREVIAAQSVSVIKSLLAIGSLSGSEVGNLRLTIPYFGTVSVARPPPSPPTQKSHIPAILPNNQPITFDANVNADDSWGGLPYTQDSSGFPVVSFTSSHFQPSLQQDQIPWQDWGVQQADTMFFDSLLSTDIDGNWIL